MSKIGVKYKPWWSDGLFFGCLQCGRCCRGEPGSVWVTEIEIDRIAVYLEMDRNAFAKKKCVLRNGRISLRERFNGDCVMLDRSANRCGIYGLRPAQCRLFPFWPSLLESRDAWEAEAGRCPGINHGKFWSPDEISQLLDQSPFSDL